MAKYNREDRTDIMTFGNVRGECIVEEALAGALFKVLFKPSGAFIMCTLNGNMRRFKIKLVPGDSVVVEVSPHDLTRGRVVHRY